MEIVCATSFPAGEKARVWVTARRHDSRKLCPFGKRLVDGRRISLAESRKASAPVEDQASENRARTDVPDAGHNGALRDPESLKVSRRTMSLIKGVSWQPKPQAHLRWGLGDENNASWYAEGFGPSDAWHLSLQCKYPGSLIADCEDGTQLQPAMKRRVCEICSYERPKEKRANSFITTVKNKAVVRYNFIQIVVRYAVS